MATRTQAPEHGALHDIFPQRPQSVHGGAMFDEGFTLQTLEQANGRLHDIFGVSPDGGTNGQRHDEFGWRELPRLHGSYFDEDFRSELGFDGTDGHTSWFDVFSPGTGVRYLSQGQEVEGIISHVERDHAVVESGGKTIEVGLSQFLAYRSPSVENASPFAADEADTPSAHSHDAHGGGRTASPGYGQPWDATPQGQDREPRQGPPGGLMDTVDRLKAITDSLDVTKAPPSEGCLGKTHFESIISKTPLSESTASWSRFGGNMVLKEVASTETAAQGSPADYCPACKTVRKEAKHGECPSCKGKLVAKTSVDADAPDDEQTTKTSIDRLNDIAKAFGAPADPKAGGQTVTVSTEAKTGTHPATSDPAGPAVPEREHKTSDHHEDGSQRTSCPHCGGALALNDERTEQGQPAHKCIGSALDLLKASIA